MAANTQITEVLPAPEGGIVRGYQMQPNESVPINLGGRPLENHRQGKKQFGLRAPIVAHVEAGDHSFHILDTRGQDRVESPFAVVDQPIGVHPNVGYKGVWTARPLIIGRSHHKDRFNYHPSVSRDHFMVAFDGLGLVVQNLRPSASTVLSGNLMLGQDRYEMAGIRDVFTQAAVDEARRSPGYSPESEATPNGYHFGHPIIGRESPSVRDGVYFTVGSEIVRVDDKSPTLQGLTTEMSKRFQAKFGPLPATNIRDIKAGLKFANRYAQWAMPYNLKATRKLCQPYYDGNGMIDLSEFVDKKIGVCRHQCLLVALFEEELIGKGLLIGRSGVERNENIEANGAHAWAHFTPKDGEKLIVDPANNFVGTKAEANAQGIWKYNLSTD